MKKITTTKANKKATVKTRKNNIKCTAKSVNKYWKILNVNIFHITTSYCKLSRTDAEKDAKELLSTILDIAQKTPKGDSNTMELNPMIYREAGINTHIRIHGSIKVEFISNTRLRIYLDSPKVLLLALYDEMLKCNKILSSGVYIRGYKDSPEVAFDYDKCIAHVQYVPLELNDAELDVDRAIFQKVMYSKLFDLWNYQINEDEERKESLEYSIKTISSTGGFVSDNPDDIPHSFSCKTSINKRKKTLTANIKMPMIYKRSLEKILNEAVKDHIFNSYSIDVK